MSIQYIEQVAFMTADGFTSEPMSIEEFKKRGGRHPSELRIIRRPIMKKPKWNDYKQNAIPEPWISIREYEFSGIKENLVFDPNDKSEDKLPKYVLVTFWYEERYFENQTNNVPVKETVSDEDRRRIQETVKRIENMWKSNETQ
jgi:hypothetical protein